MNSNVCEDCRHGNDVIVILLTLHTYLYYKEGFMVTSLRPFTEYSQPTPAPTSGPV